MRKKNFHFIPFLICLLFSATVMAQGSFVIKGTIVDEAGNPLNNVTVKQRGTANAVTSTADGSFSITVVSDTAQLQFSHVGMQLIFEPINRRSIINITMKAKVRDLDDVIVIGYNTTKRKDLTASVSSIGKESLSQRTLFSLADAMKGKAAGVQITQNDGTPGSGYTFRIRGASSISAGSSPLFVIDGVLQDDANNINPGDIENIEVLKDASGTAMYGARGANGVFIITTKSGKAGKTALEFYSNMAYQTPGHLFDIMRTPDFAHTRFLASAYLFTPASATNPNLPASTQTGYTYYRDSPLGTDGGFWGVIKDAPYHDWDKYNSPDSINTDWQDAMFQNNLINEYRINMAGGSRDTKFSLSGGYLDQGGLVVFSNYKRYTGRFNLQQKLNSTINMTLNLSGGQTNTGGFVSGSLNGGIASNAIITAMLNKPPTEPLTQRDVEDNADVTGYITTNPYSLAKNITNQRYTTDWLTRLAFDFNLSKVLTYRLTGNYSTLNANNDAYYPKFTAVGARLNGRAYLSRATTTRFMNEHLFYYHPVLGKGHKLNAIAGMTFEKNKVSQITAENQNYDIEVLGVYGLENGTAPIIPTYNITQWTMASYLGRAEYSFNNRYILTATFRADGSSRFSKNNKWGYFPSAALAWRVSDEQFMKGIKTISDLKIRTSIGQSGNTAIPSYLTLSTIGTYFSPMDGNTPNYGVVVEQPENLSLKWETTTQLNVGMDLGLLNNKIVITAEWYQKRTKDLLIKKVTPAYSGFRSAWTNLGSIQNSGIEFNLTGIIIDKRTFGWSVDANIGYNRSKAIEIGSTLSLDPAVVPGVGTTAIIRNGEPIGQWFGYVTDGIYQSYAEIRNSGFTNINGQAIAAVRPGSRRFIDQNGDGIINSDDRVILGQGQPKFTGGFTNNLRYKNLSLNIVVQYSYGNKIYNANRVTLEQGRNPTNMASSLKNAWTPSLYDMTSGALVEQGNPNNQYRMPGGVPEILMLSDWIEDGSYIRLADVTIAYNISPKKASNKIGWKGLTLFASGKNLWISTNYQGYDPEVNTRQGGFGDLMPSLDFASYPRSRLYSFGLKLQF